MESTNNGMEINVSVLLHMPQLMEHADHVHQILLPTQIKTFVFVPSPTKYSTLAEDFVRTVLFIRPLMLGKLDVFVIKDMLLVILVVFYK